jgi:xylan 1,4-beta-xylosidase
MDDLVPGTGGAMGTGATGVGGTGTGGAGNTGGAGTGGAGTGGVVIGTGGVIVVPTVECVGPFPTNDVSAAAYKVNAGGGSLGTLPHFWNTFGLGRLGLYLDDSLLADAHKPQNRLNFDGEKWSDVFRAQTVAAVEELGLNSVRAHGLFHDDIGIYSEDGSGTPVYNFERSDNIFDFLVENDIAPIIELASMPAALAADPSRTVFDWNMIVSIPKDFAKWQGLVQAFVEHSVQEYGADVVQNWYFEVWNEPECCGGKFWKQADGSAGTPEQYFQLYDAAVAGVRAVLPNGRVGGPVSSQPAQLTGGEWDGGAGNRFLDHITNTDQHLGFFTFHTWSFLDSVTGYFTGLDMLDARGLTDVQIAVTEFGPTWEFGLRGVEGTEGAEPEWEPAETTQGAAFVAQTYADIAQGCATGGRRFPITYAWWTLSDVFDEGFSDPGDYVLEETPFMGAMGLYSRENIKKPALNAYSFLAKMGTEQQTLTVEGDPADVGGMATRDTADGGVQVLLYNGQDPGGGFGDDTYYAVTDAQEIGITVSGLSADMAYDVTVYRVDATHGNAWGIWDSQGRPTMATMTTEQWDAVRAGMESAPESVATAVCGATFSQSFALSSPGALLLTIEPAVAAP